MGRLWSHECMRVFHDRLVSENDKEWFTSLVEDLVKRNFGISDYSCKDFCVFGKFTNPGVPFADNMYSPSQSTDRVSKMLNGYLDDYNLSHPSQMNLVFFKDAIERVSRICRILAQPRGNVMLVGVGGSGKQSMTRLGLFIAGMKCFQIEITSGYGNAEFHEDLKTMMLSSGVENKPIGFLFTDTQIVLESFVEDINNILNTGEVPNLFPPDEMESLINSMRPQLKESGIPETRENCKAEFVSRVRDNLHIILAMSPVGDAFRVRCRQFPSLINCCTIDWYLPWPETALESVAMRFIGSVELPAEEMRIALADACVHVHTSIAHMGERFFETLRRKTYTTPKSYLDLVELYLSMLKEKRSEYGGARNRLDNGVIKLAETNEMVGKLKASLEQLMPTLEQKSKETDGLLKQVAKEQSDAKKVEEKVSAEEARVNEEAAQVAKLQAEAKRDLDKAMPALEEAIAALDSLDKKDITEMKSFKTPLPAVMTVMEAVNVLLGEKADWDTAKRVLGNMHLIENLKQFDKDSISSGVLKKLRKYTNDPIMQVENVKKVSSAATSLCVVPCNGYILGSCERGWTKAGAVGKDE